MTQKRTAIHALLPQAKQPPQEKTQEPVVKVSPETPKRTTFINRLVDVFSNRKKAPAVAAPSAEARPIKDDATAKDTASVVSDLHEENVEIKEIAVVVSLPDGSRVAEGTPIELRTLPEAPDEKPVTMSGKANSKGAFLFKGDDVAAFQDTPFQISVAGVVVNPHAELAMTDTRERIAVTFDEDDLGLDDDMSDEEEGEEADLHTDASEGKSGKAKDDVPAVAEPSALAKIGGALLPNLALVLILAAVLFLVYVIRTGTPVTSTFNTPTEPPQFIPTNPLDFGNASWLEPKQWFFLFSGVLCIFFVAMDRVKAREINDFWAMVKSLVVIFGLKFFTAIGVGLINFFAPARGINTEPANALFWLSIAAIFGSYNWLRTAADQGGKDKSIWGGFAAVVGLVGLISAKLGAFQVFLNIPSNAVRSFNDVKVLLLNRDLDLAAMSVAVYFCLIVAVIIHIFEVIRLLPDSQEKGAWKANAWQLLRLTAAPLFIIIMHYVDSGLSLGTVYALGIAGASVLANLDFTQAPANAPALNVDDDVKDRADDSQPPTPQGTYIVGRPLRFPYDSLVAQILIVVLYVVFTGHL